jgi:aquaporin Z
MTGLLLKVLVEFFGTTLFLSVVQGVGEPVAIAVALLAVIFFGGAVSGGHFNPAITLMKLFSGQVTGLTAILYILVQLAAIGLAVWYTRAAKLA